MLAVLLLAAGSSSRMRGGDKLLETVDGQPLLQKLAAQSCKMSETVLVALAEPDTPRHHALRDLNVRPVFVPDAALGMGHSLRAGISSLPASSTAVMIVPTDMPELSLTDFQKMASAFADSPDAILRGASSEGKPGHPVVFPKRLFSELHSLDGDTGARKIIRAHAEEVVLVSLENDHALIDLDTPEQWDAWRQQADA